MRERERELNDLILEIIRAVIHIKIDPSEECYCCQEEIEDGISSGQVCIVIRTFLSN